MKTTPSLPRGMRSYQVAFALLIPAIMWVTQSRAETPGPQATEAVKLDQYQRVLYVDQSTGDDIKGDGSLAQPLASVPKAIEAAGRPAEDSRVAILVTQGRYKQATFALKSHVDFYGGFAQPGGDRDIYQYATLLDGAEQNRIAFGADHARVDGFHFVNARVRGKGAAILCDANSPTISNCVFVNNRTLIPIPWNPPLLHETANDGGAIMCVNGAAPRIEHNLFFANSTECGRGAALAVDRAAVPTVSYNVFANNRAGLDDPMRSSDGGAVSYFDGSGGVFDGNVVVANEALTKNDAGGVFVALWSAPILRRNIIVANESGDDAGGLFLGGQEHRYDAPLDSYPPAEKFTILVDHNVFVGNVNASRNSGAMRVTMETRAHFTGNLITENKGGLYLQRSEITADRNTVWQEWRFLEDKETLGPSRFTGNIFMGPTDAFETKRVTFSGNMAPANTPGGPHLPVEDIFIQDDIKGGLTDLHFDPATMTTTVTTSESLPDSIVLAGRPIRMSDDIKTGGQWRVIARAKGQTIVVWGRLDAVTKAPEYFEILRTFTPKPGSPAGLGIN